MNVHVIVHIDAMHTSAPSSGPLGDWLLLLIAYTYFAQNL